MNYANIVKSAQTGKAGGYKPKMFFVAVDDVLTWERPITPAVALGDKYKIITPHVMKPDKTYFEWDAKTFSVLHVSEATGDEGAKEMLHKVTIKVNGDNPATYEQMQNLLNDNVVIFIKDADCLANNTYIQFGDDCNPMSVTTNFDGSNNGLQGIQKEYTIELQTKAKYFYTADLPAEAEEEG